MDQPAGETMQAVLARLYDRLHARALLLTQRPDAAEDLVQDVCERTLSRQGTYQPGTNVWGWLTRVMHNLFIDGCRAQRVRVTVPADVELFVEASPDRPLSAHDLLDTEDVLLAMGELPPSFQSLMMLAHFEGLPYREISLLLGVTQATVGTRLFRARRRLRAVLERTYEQRLLAFSASRSDRRKANEKRYPCRSI